MRFGVFNEYKGYTGSIEYSFEDKCHYGKILNISNLVNYQANTIKDLYNEFQKAVDDYIEFKNVIEVDKCQVEKNS